MFWPVMQLSCLVACIIISIFLPVVGKHFHVEELLCSIWWVRRKGDIPFVDRLITVQLLYHLLAVDYGYRCVFTQCRAVVADKHSV